MSNYFKAFFTSLLIHTLVLGLIYQAGVFLSRQSVLVVDFSSVTLGELSAGGDSAPSPPPPPKEEAPEETPEEELALPPEEEEIIPQPLPKPPPPRPVPKPKPVPTPVPSSPAPTASSEPAASSPEPAEASPNTPGENGTDTLPSPGPASGEARSPDADVYVTANFQYILHHIRRQLVYPPRARRMGWSGTSTFSFLITREGHVENLVLQGSSGQDVLDDAARDAILRAAPFPRPPVPARIIIPIIFKLT
jgi:protein TonB